MRVTRRSVLLGLGTISATVGGAFGSGAFSSVEAARSVNINTSDDSDALVSFEQSGDNNGIVSTGTTDGAASVIKLKQELLNRNATTTFNGVLKVTNTSNKDVGISVDRGQTGYDSSSGDTDLVGKDQALNIKEKDGNTIVDPGPAADDKGANAINLATSSSTKLTIVVDLRGSNTSNDIGNIDSIVFAARSGDYS